MLILKDSCDVHRLVLEMINYEVGRQLYVDGAKVPWAKAVAYPSFSHDGIRDTIRTTVGVLVVRSSIERAVLASALQTEFERHGADHLTQYTPLECGTNHFTALRAKPSDTEKLRKIVVLNNGIKAGTLVDAKVRFTWVLVSVTQMLTVAATGTYTHIPMPWQLVTIFWDQDDVLTCPAGTILSNNLTLRDVKVTARVLPLCYAGAPTPERIAEWGQAVAEPTAQSLAQAAYIGLIKANQHLHEYIPWHPGLHNMIICPQRGIGGEIIRQAGKLDADTLNAIFLPINRKMTIYSVPREKMTLSREDCMSCSGPLYDDIYVLFENKSATTGKPLCKFCAHGPGNLVLSDPPPNQVVARTRMTTTAAQVIDSLPCDQIVKDVLHAAAQSTRQYSHEFNTVLVFGEKYIGWNRSLLDYALVFRDATDPILSSGIPIPIHIPGTDVITGNTSGNTAK